MNTTSRSESESSANDTETGSGSFRRSLKHHAVTYSVAGGIALAALVGGGVAWASTPAHAGTSMAVSTSTGTHTKHSTDHAHKKHEVTGVVTSVAESHWTIRTHNNKIITITITSSTAFGTAKKPATEASFVVGDRVVVSGHRDDSTVTARRILHAHRVHRHAESSSSATAGA